MLDDSPRGERPEIRYIATESKRRSSAQVQKMRRFPKDWWIGKAIDVFQDESPALWEVGARTPSHPLRVFELVKISGRNARDGARTRIAVGYSAH